MRFETLNALNNKHGRIARQVARRQQRERIAGVLVVCLGIAVLLVAVVALRAPNGRLAASGENSRASNVAKNSPSHSPTSSKSAPPPSRASHPVASAKDVPLIVLNNTTIAGLAQQAAERFEAGGWTVTSFGNYQNEIASTCAYYDPSVSGARAAARALQREYPAIQRVEPRFAPDPGAEPLPDGPVVVVLTPDYSPA